MYKRNKNVKSGAAIRARFQAGQKKKVNKPVQGPKEQSKRTAKNAGDKLMDTFRKLTKVDNRSPSGRKIVDEKAVEKTSGGGRGKGKRLITVDGVKPTGGSRQGAGKQSRDRKLFGNIFGGTYTSRGNRR